MKTVLRVLLGASVASIATAQANCAAPASLSYNNAALPDPFTFAGSTTKVATTSDWDCRRQQLSQLIQKYELGTLPTSTPTVSATFSGNTLSITVTDNGKSITFTPTITYPTSGTAPYPAIIGYDGGSLPAQSGVAQISLNTNDIALQTDSSSRGQGKYYTLYGSTASAGALTAWAWSVSRIIDALEKTPSARIDATRIGVTGCSRDGKGAMVAGALETRIKLTIPQESGSGGAACWRLSQSESQVQQVQTAPEIVTENVWFSTSFNSYVNSLATLPFDHHLLAALIAPRGLIVLENTDYIWLSPKSSFGCMTAARSVYQALGATSNFGFSQIGGHSHCVFPSSQAPEIGAFFQKFLLNQSGANTDVFHSTQTWPGSGQSQWINWTTPNLVSGNGSGSPTTTAAPPPGTTLSTATSAAPSSSAPGGGGAGCAVAKYGQCGGQGWSGCTACASGSTCQAVSAPYYSQCL